MCNTVVELCQLATVPAVGGTYQVAGDALKLVDVVAAALRTYLQVGIGILVAAVQTAVAVVVHGTIAHVVLVHHVYHAGDDCWVVGSVAVNLYIEDVAATGQVVVRSLDLCLLQRCTLVVYRHVVGVGIVVAPGMMPNSLRSFLVNLPLKPSAGVASTE